MVVVGGGGYYERLVRIAKASIRRIARARLAYEEMETVLIGIEVVINCRPLTYMYEDDIQDPITPSHLIC